MLSIQITDVFTCIYCRTHCVLRAEHPHERNLVFKCQVYSIFCTKTTNDALNSYKTIFKAQQKQTSCRNVAPLCYTSSPVDLSKLLLVTKFTRLHLDCVPSPPHNSHGNRSHGDTVLRTTQENSSNARHAFKLSVFRTYIYSVFI